MIIFEFQMFDLSYLKVDFVSDIHTQQAETINLRMKRERIKNKQKLKSNLFQANCKFLLLSIFKPS